MASWLDRARLRIFCSGSSESASTEQPELEVTLSPMEFDGSGLSDVDEVLEVKTLRHRLEPMRSTLIDPNDGDGGVGFVDDNDRVTLQTSKYADPNSSTSGANCAYGVSVVQDGDEACIPLPPWAIRSGPRRTIYWDPSKVTAAIVTCGGLCPGLNDVVQSIVFTLVEYGVAEDQILGIRFGLRGFYDHEHKPIYLSRAAVEDIHMRGGTVLGTSRGGADIQEIVRKIDLWNVSMVFVIGGNGGNAAANAIQEECEAQDVLCSVVGVPKSIDNDILLIDRCFGFDTAVFESQRALKAAKVEARSAHNGVGLVKLMGRQSGFIAMQASMASGVVDICLVPEMPFTMEKLCSLVETKMEEKGHCVVCVAEGAGQNLTADGGSGTDASGNPILKDIGRFLKRELASHFKGTCDIKYIDPTYMIRAIPTIPQDHIYCKVLGQGAVHGAFAGYTGFTIGLVFTHYAFLPIPTVIQAPRLVDPRGRDWSRLKTAIRQPALT